MKIIFLDFDGVLNSHEYILNRWDKTKGGCVDLDSQAVALVQRICRLVPDARIVVSSSWRIHHRLTELKDLLAKGGLDPRLVIGKTPQFPPVAGHSQRRGAEIALWLGTTLYEIEKFVILDDDSDMEPFLHRHLKTEFALGLTEEHVKRAVEMLG
jgi:HAD domain in Swiss Army Knife RNA repair proteins